MTKINYVIGDATLPIGTGRRVIAHICNNYGGWGAGFVLALNKRSIAPQLQYRDWATSYNDPWGLKLSVPFELGELMLAPFMAEDVYVANMIAQKGDLVDYTALEVCLNRLSQLARVAGFSVHMPRIGCGLGGGRWEKVQPIIMQQLCSWNISVTVYDLPSHQPVRHADLVAIAAPPEP